MSGKTVDYVREGIERFAQIIRDEGEVSSEAILAVIMDGVVEVDKIHLIKTGRAPPAFHQPAQT